MAMILDMRLDIRPFPFTCRSPASSMIRRASARYNVWWVVSLVVGDARAAALGGREAGMGKRSRRWLRGSTAR